ncbi:MAG TPA: ATP-binding cassette domain-containing protein [Gemmatimonadaceae bacterium]|nr:ATP-binding cassette domain-containing protein [Gemmatimonadaceae bacterium]
MLGVDLDVEEGEILGIVGTAGAGKTTLLLCAAGLLRRDGGSVRWFGEKFAGGGCLPGLVYVPAVPTYYPFLKVRDVLHYYSARDGSQGARRARLITDTATRLGLTDLMGSCAGTLDAETLKRVAIAQAIVDEPKVMLLDGSLDMLGGGSLLVHRALRETAAAGATIIATSRQVNFLAHVSSRIAVMDAGWLTGSFAAARPHGSAFPSIVSPARHIAETIH